MAANETTTGDGACDWCDRRATAETQTPDDGRACDAHVRDLERVAEGRAWRSGNPEPHGLVREIATGRVIS